ncbi:MAG TPA: hypothetical protein VM368_00115, partial [Flavisolibacter sp.]|nr:hypothetical protein [Flavisolibacter sp.]
MPCKIFLLVSFLIVSAVSVAQNPVKDSLAIDTSFTDYDLLFDEMDAFFDSILAPRSFTLVNVGLSRRFFSVVNNEFRSETVEKISVTPSLGYYDKSGFGINVEASMIRENNQFTPFQYSITPSYDYIQNRDFTTGI